MATPIGLQVNCCYARVAIFELSQGSKGKSRSTLDIIEIAGEFQRLFAPGSFLTEPADYWDNFFGRHLTHILDCFSKAWYPYELRKEYITSFSIAKWGCLSREKQAQHTMSACIPCGRDHLQLQKAFPAPPCFVPPPSIVSISIPENSTERTVTRAVLQELDHSYHSNYQHKFVDSVVKVCGKAEGVQHRKTASEKKKEQRKCQRKFRDAVNQQFCKNAGVSFLAENESFSGYQRKRLSQSFESKSKSASKTKRHVPSEASVCGYRDIVLEKVSLWPEDKIINWTQLAGECKIEGKNRGQIAKVIAEECGVPASRLVSNRKKSSRRSKAKLPGNEVSMPCLPTTNIIKEEINSLIETGQLRLGEPCAPYTLIKSSVVEGVVERTNSIVYGRKIPLTEIRNKLNRKHEKFMHLLGDDEIDVMTVSELRSHISRVEEVTPIASSDILKSRLKSLQRTRHLALWHDHSSILGAGYLLMTVHVLYDSAVFLNNNEYTARTGEILPNHIQEIVEEPELYMLCLSSSSPSDQVATIADRLDCLSDLKNPTKSSLGIEIYDKLLFFVGDHPAQSFERGSQIGGNYKCGNCGCKVNRMDDLAHVFQCPWRTLEELQNLVLLGHYGKKAGVLKPFDKLKKAELLEELRKRGGLDVELDKMDKAELASTLTGVLKGAQRVPTILITNPSQNLADLNLSQYAILDCEPLHDMKGHLINLLTELPDVLVGSVKKLALELLTNILYSKKKNGYSGSDLRLALIETYKLLYFQQTDQQIKILLSTAVKISEILYSTYEKRTPKSILQLYNCTWLHHEICKSIFTNPHDTSYTKFFGTYLHALVAHGPIQYEVVCLRSVNTENEERIFQQAKTIASATTNRKPENVIPSIMLRLQAKQLNGKIASTFAAAETDVKKVAKTVPEYERTCVPASFIKNRSHSWQAHLERISHYLVLGESKWWQKSASNCFTFFDGDSDPNSQPEGPLLENFRSVSTTNVIGRSKAMWNKILADKIPIPCTSIREYDNNGDLVSLRSAETSSNMDDDGDFDDFPSLNCSAVQQPNEHNVPATDQQEVTLITSTPIRSSSSARRPNCSPIEQMDEQNVDPIPDQTQEASTPIRGSSSAHRQLSTPSCSSTNYLQFEDHPSSSHDESCDVELVLSEDEGEQFQTGPQLKSTLALAIQRALGNDPDIIYFDKLHTKLKTQKTTHSSIEKATYTRSLASLQQKVLSKKLHIAEKIEIYEKTFYKKHHILPVKQKDYVELCTALSYMKKLLRKWNISL